MNFKNTILLSLLSLELSCGTGSSLDDRPHWPEKSDEAALSCQGFSLLGDLALEGHYIHKLLNCASNQSPAAGESLDGILTTVNTLGPEGIQHLIRLLMTPNPKGVHREDTYPFLTVLKVVLERGMRGHHQETYTLVNQRLDELQPLLKELNIHRSLELLQAWQTSGQLVPQLKTLHQLIAQLDRGDLSALSNLLLADSTATPHLLGLASSLLLERPFVIALENQLSPTNSFSLLTEANRSLATDCLKQWSESRPVGMEQNCLEDDIQSPLAEENPQSGASRIKDFVSSLGYSKLRKLIAAGKVLITDYQENSREERHSLHLDATTLGEDLVRSQQDPLSFFLSLLNHILDTDAAELDLLASGAAKLLTPGFDATLNQLRSKIGTSLLIDRTQDLIVTGGPVPGCGDLSLPGLAGMIHDLEASKYLLSQYLNPHESCGYLPPLAVAMVSYLGATLSYDCQGVSSETICLTVNPAHYPKFASNLWQAPFASDPLLNQELLLAALDDMIQETTKDPYYLWNFHLSHGAIDIQQLQQLRQRISTYRDGLSAQEIAKLDLEYSDSELNLFADDFLENIIAIKIKKLSSQVQQFSNLIPEAEGLQADYKAAQVFGGLYTDGPMIQIFRDHMTTDRVLAEMDDDYLREQFSGREDRLSQFLFPFKHANSIFANPSLNRRDMARVQSFLLGSSSTNFVGIQADGSFVLEDKNSVSPNLAVMDRPEPTLSENWGLWTKYLKKKELPRKDLPLSITGSQGLNPDSFQLWAEESLSKWQESSYWEKAFSRQEFKAIDARFFQGESYSVQEARLIALYFSNHYLKTPYVIPSDYTIHGGSTFSKVKPWGAFMNLGFLGPQNTEVFPWKIFHNTFPTLFSRNYASFEELQEQLLPVYQEVMGQELFGKRLPYGRPRNMENFAPNKFSNDTLRLFSSLNLLTYTNFKNAAVVQPVVGVGGRFCHLNHKSSSPSMACPIEISPSKPEELAYEDLQGYVAETLAAKLCPLLQDEEWQKQLGLPLATPETCRLPAQRLFTIENSGQSLGMGKTILRDIFNVGKNPRLRPEISLLQGAIAHAKLAKKSYPKSRAAKLWLASISSPISEDPAAFDWYMQLSSLGMRTGQTTLVGSYSGFLGDILSPTLYVELSKQLALRTPEGSERAVVLEILESFVALQKTMAANKLGALELGLELGDKILADKHLRQTLVHMLANHSSPASFEFLATDLHEGLTGLLGPDFDWGSKGAALTRYFINRDLLLSSRSLLDQNTSGLARMFETLHKSLQQLGPPSEQGQILRQIATLLVKLTMTWDGESLGIESWENIADLWGKYSFSSQIESHFNGLMGTLQDPLKTLNETPGASLLAIGERFTYGALVHGPDLLIQHQRARTEIPANDGFLSALALDVLLPVAEDRRGAAELGKLLGDQRLGFTDNLWLEAMGDETNLDNVNNAVAAVAKVSKEEWNASLDQTADLFPRLAPLLSYLQDRGQWQGRDSEELKDSVTTFLHLSENKEGLFDRQLELTRSWLTAPARLY